MFFLAVMFQSSSMPLSWMIWTWPTCDLDSLGNWGIFVGRFFFMILFPIYPGSTGTVHRYIHHTHIHIKLHFYTKNTPTNLIQIHCDKPSPYSTMASWKDFEGFRNVCRSASQPIFGRSLLIFASESVYRDSGDQWSWIHAWLVCLRTASVFFFGGLHPWNLLNINILNPKKRTWMLQMIFPFQV